MSSAGRASMNQPRASEVEAIIATAEIDTTFGGRKYKYRGKRSMWPGALALFLVIAGSIVGLTYFGIKLKQDTERKEEAAGIAQSERFGSGQKISDGLPVRNETIDVTNPASFKDKGCTLPDYTSKNGVIYASVGGTEVPLKVKGVNWLGAEKFWAVPDGLWDSSRAGSTIYRIGEFLSGNNFNMVRIPLSIDAALNDVIPDVDKINTNSNRALQYNRYIKLLGSIAQGLGQFNIGVVLDFQVLNARAADSNDLWYGETIKIDDIKTAITNLAKGLCDNKHFNVIGLDLKDAPAKASWGDGSDTDWQKAATELGNHLLGQCKQWLVFVQGVQGSSRRETYGTRTVKSKYWAGADLTGVKDKPVTLKIRNKVVYAPPYFTNSKIPQPYFFDSGDQSGDRLVGYTESDNLTLEQNVLQSMDNMFGDAISTGSAVVLSSFGGLVGASDPTRLKTSSRIVDILVKKMLTTRNALGGGFWWTLNPGAQWDHPLPDKDNVTFDGLLDDSWRAANMDILKTLSPLDAKVIATIPCQE